MRSHFLPRLRFHPQSFYLQSCDISRPLGEICEEDEKILESTGAVLLCLCFVLASVSATYFGNTHSGRCAVSLKLGGRRCKLTHFYPGRTSGSSESSEGGREGEDAAAAEHGEDVLVCSSAQSHSGDMREQTQSTGRAAQSPLLAEGQLHLE